ncbi:MAG: hypothetical protein DRN81_04875 [Thermoproteota archaeon]|nr:MAG: hypothetical protein DRN81_04875 [Candidatus Korarchaeota archaeon]
MAEILLGNIISKLETSEDILKQVRKKLSTKPKNYWFYKKFRSKKWDGTYYFMNKSGSFPTGLLHLVKDALREIGVKYDIIDKRNIPDIKPKDYSLNGITLRDYQKRTIEKCLLYKRGVIELATNAGKTEIACGVIKALQLPTLFIVNSKDLLYQTADRIKKRTGIDTGIIGDGIWDEKEVNVATIQTLQYHLTHDKTKTKKLLNKTRLLIIDEAHHTKANTWNRVMRQIPAWYRIGMSGTPFRKEELDDWRLMAVTGRCIAKISNKKLIDLGFSAKPIIHIVRYNTPSYITARYQEAYDKAIVNNEHRNNVIVAICNDLKGLTLVIVDKVAHGLLLNTLIPESVFISGRDKSDTRKEILQAMRNREVDIVIATPIFDEGIDVPSIDNVILACGGVSRIKLLQRIGRGLRKKEGKENILHVYDFLDDCNRFTYQHSRKRIKTYKAEKFKIKIERKYLKIC